jgi:uncharacterized protein
MEINGSVINRGEDKLIHLSIARLPTYTHIDLPIRIIRSEKKGPVLLLSGGLHGDEINGVEIVRRMLARKLIIPDAGSVIAIPVMNVYGFIQNVRGVPDGKDINRSFPGNKAGSLANLVAYTIMKEIIPLIDYGVDFHTGGASRSNYPQIRCVFDIEKNLELARAFAPPVILHSGMIDKTFRKAAYKKKKHILVYETGESLRLDEFGIQQGINGTLRLMKHIGMKNEAPEAGETEIFEKSSWVRARYAGLFHPKVDLGESIKHRQSLGIITDPFGNESFRIVSKMEGRVIGLNNNPVVNKGDAIFHIAKHK